MSLVDHAERELELSGYGAEYDGMIGETVMELVKVFANQGHSGFSAMQTAAIFNELAQFKPLGPLTDSSEEWMDLTDYESGLYQNRRRPDAFSYDGGKTYYLVDDEPRVIYNSEPATQ